MSKEDLYLYPVWLRVWHGINAICIILLIITGLSMQYGNLEYPLLSFEISVTLHNLCGIIASIGYIFFLVFNHFSGNGKQYVPNYKGFMDRLIKQANYYLKGYFKGEPKPFPITKDNKFNPMQRLAYITAMYVLVPVVVVTGIALLFPEMIIEQIFNTSGIGITAILHSIGGFFISLFLIVHLYVASIGKHPLKNYKSIVDGYHRAE